MNNARLFSHFACGWHPETLLLARPVSQFTRKVSHLCPGNPYQISLCRVYKRRQTYYKPRARGGARPARCYAPASGGKTGASRLDGPQTPLACSGLSGSPARSAAGALPTPYGRRFPCASIRARRRARDAIVYRSLWLAGKRLSSASNLGKPHRGASGRRQSPRGAGGRSRDAGQRRGPALPTPEVGWAAQPSTGGRECATSRRIPADRHLAMHALSLDQTPSHADFQPAETMSVSCPKFMSDKRGLGVFRAQLRHAKDMASCARKTPSPHPSGVEMRSRSGVVLGRFLTA
ncbi:hypothetical protein LMG27177_05754 [Paraburkholderia fynbosensis]|uniref:Uncharacterized protein n=1 Tax=Paraburkholderia fynbosensis TaxID=1200993 RepID=A0A6J5GQA8_9BURK|nr:hypothetical protein LMG27177_05754 [Paraburkholderia fynbosensis]